VATLTFHVGSSSDRAGMIDAEGQVTYEYENFVRRIGMTEF
jgi:hypothetical protein